MKFSICVPTYNAGELWQSWLAAYQNQRVKAQEVVIVDSSSTDNTCLLSEQAGFVIKKIAKSEFNHGGTRNQAVRFCEKNADVIIFMTQDALLANENALAELLKPFEDDNVAAVYGRQLPHQNANPIAAHARLFNYPAKSSIKTKEDIHRLGIKTAFISNSFAAYRKTVFDELGGFPDNTIFAEDMYLAAKMILAGYKVAYAAEAKVYHSHNYNLWQEFQRYFDIGVFQRKEKWIQESFGKASGEGIKFVFSELNYLLENAPFWIPKACFSTLFKFLGFKCGLNHTILSNIVCRNLSMNKSYWQ